MRKNLWYKLLILLFLSVAGLIITSLSSVLLYKYSNCTEDNILKISLLIQQIFVFALPAIIAAKLAFGNVKQSLLLDTIKSKGVLWAILFIIIAIPAIDTLAQLNTKIHFPNFLSDIETWMRETEAQTNAITERLLSVITIKGLITNILIIALAAAISEELLFRGFLQRIFEEKFNHHVAIWTTAFIFSAIHFQFLGFIPRMLLGASFGYMAVWSRSLWVPIIAHFLNNAIGVVAAYLNNNQIVDIELENFSYTAGAISFTLSILIMYIMRRSGKPK